ncbi:uncharacterized protein DS421_2g39710 [Arachis hypogaea]|nr:uncharacterized protein DS421_2g39710 [Arachis hypogaea]
MQNDRYEIQIQTYDRRGKSARYCSGTAVIRDWRCSGGVACSDWRRLKTPGRAAGWWNHDVIGEAVLLSGSTS